MRILTAIVFILALVPSAQAVELLSAGEARAAALAGDIVVVDIRTPEEWAETGVADVARLASLHGPGLAQKLHTLRKANPGKPLALICATGVRSSYLSAALEQRGWEVLNIREGMLGSADGPGWLGRGLPVRRPEVPAATE